MERRQSAGLEYDYHRTLNALDSLTRIPFFAGPMICFVWKHAL